MDQTSTIATQKIKQKINYKQNIIELSKNWRFWTKLLIGFLPILSMIIFSSFQVAKILWFRANHVFPSFWVAKYSTTLAELESWSVFQSVFQVYFRNIFLYTSYSTIIFSAFFLNSAFNTKHEGDGKYDNSYFGLWTLVIMGFTIFFYNLSLFITKDYQTWTWNHWISMFLQHSLVPIVGVIYFLLFYQHKTTFSYNRNKMLIWWGYSGAAILGYYFIFTVLGYILKASGAWKLFPDMSYSGYFPYDFMEFTNQNATYTGGVVPMAVQTFLIYFAFILIISGLYFGFYFAIVKRVKYQNNLLKNHS
ncbi:hypothetical protein [Spiroplasma chrysopicola]|uniref:Transmembrane protein n=1 Tax=Spiroplasma chrysopicola DF-1 TaxID=1276227 RepID=R4UBH0_9MOLU|nr:hypothetical protein [Spiroplasma chrysopicola]AGM25239.1 hypothetical protein SCHRY_v1c06630 [Spiroplasma chrysopicola DF-1]